MRTPLAWHNLRHSKVRTATALAGVMFAVIMIVLQLGFLRATERAASLIYEALDFDLVIRSRQARRISQSPTFMRARLDLAATAPFVGAVCPVNVAFNRWRIPSGPSAGFGRRILTLGVRPGDPVFRDAEMHAEAARLTEPEFALIDRLARAEFGPKNGRRFSTEDLGTENEVGGHRVRLVGLYALGASFDADGSIVVSDEGFRRLYPGWGREMISLGLVKLRPGVDADQAAAELGAMMLADVEVLTRDEVIARERHIWLWEMSIGLVFVMGVAVALLVGTAIVYQILSSDVTSHLPEYATLKAMGYRDGFLGRVVIGQALILSVCGFVPGLLVALGLYALTRWATNIPIGITPLRVALVGLLSVGMCVASGLIALRKLRGAAPADLFR